MDHYKLICCDIDGTLLDEQHQISDRSKAVITALVEKGIIFALVSGRSPQSLALLQQELGITGPMGCFNGALSLDEQRRVIDERPIDYQEAMHALDDLIHTELEFFLYTNQGWYVQEKNSWHDAEVKLTSIPGTIAPLRELQEHLRGEEKPFKLLAMHRSRSYITEMTGHLQQHFSDKLTIVNSHPNYIEILPFEANKGQSVLAFERAYTIDVGRVITIGDYHNDIPMFKASGLAVAMGNAPLEVQGHAQRIIGSNTEDGLAQFLETLL